MALKLRLFPVAALTRQLFHSSFHSSSVRDFSSNPADVVKKQDDLVPERFYGQVNIKVKGADFRVLESYCRFVTTAAKALDIDMGERIALPTRIQKFTVLKSPHIYKKHRVQYEIRTHSRIMEAKEITGTTSDVFLEYIQRNLPEGVSMSVYQEQLDTLPLLLTSPPEGEEPPPTKQPIESTKPAKPVTKGQKL